MGAQFTTTQCNSLVSDANAAALEDAKSHASAQADLLGVGLDEITASNSLGYAYGGQPGAQSGCEALPQLSMGGFPGTELASRNSIRRWRRLRCRWSVR